MLPASRRAPFGAAAVVLALAVGVVGLAPAAAPASSIAFIKDNNVWLISPDGSKLHQVTTDGTETTDYNWPSQADDGTILAKRGTKFVRLRPDGTRIGQPVPGIGSDSVTSGNLTIMSGPNDPQISPDGKRFTYWISARAIGSCPPFDPHNCAFSDTDYTFVSHVDRFTPPEEIGAVRAYRDPSWVGNDRLLAFNYGLLVKEGALLTVGAGEAGLQQWFDPPPGVIQLGQGRMTRQGDKIATLAGDESFGPAQRMLFFYGVPGPYPAVPELKCYIPQGVAPSGKFIMPSWSPDGTELAVTESDGIHIFGNIPDLRAAAPDCTQITERVLVYGSAPGWGPADVPSGGPTQPAAPSQPTTPAQPGGGTPAAMSGLAVAKRQRGRAVRVGLTVGALGGTVEATLRARKGGAKLGAAVRRGAAAGPLTLDVPLNRRGRAAQRRRGTLRLSVNLVVTPPAGVAAAAQRPVALRR
jgi:hypothetical protein